MEGSRIVAGCLPMVSPSIDLDSVASHDKNLIYTCEISAAADKNH